MIKVLESIMTRATDWPTEAQEELARLAAEIEQAHSGQRYRLTLDERSAIAEGLAQADRGEFVSDVDMDAFFNSREPDRQPT